MDILLSRLSPLLLVMIRSQMLRRTMCNLPANLRCVVGCTKNVSIYPELTKSVWYATECPRKKVPFWNFGFTNPCDNYGPTKQTKLFYEMVMYLYCVLLNPTFLEAQSELSAGGAMGDVENTPKCTCLNCIPGLAPRSCLLGLAGRRSALWWSWWRWPWWWQWWWHTCSYSANDGIWRYQVCRVPILCVCTSAG